MTPTFSIDLNVTTVRVHASNAVRGSPVADDFDRDFGGRACKNGMFARTNCSSYTLGTEEPGDQVGARDGDQQWEQKRRFADALENDDDDGYGGAKRSSQGGCRADERVGVMIDA